MGMTTIKGTVADVVGYLEDMFDFIPTHDEIITISYKCDQIPDNFKSGLEREKCIFEFDTATNLRILAFRFANKIVLENNTDENKKYISDTEFAEIIRVAKPEFEKLIEELGDIKTAQKNNLIEKKANELFEQIAALYRNQTSSK